MAGNISGKAYALTILSPIKNAYTQEEIAYADVIRDHLQNWNFENNSPMAKVPQTYLCRFFVLDDVYTESQPTGGALDTFSDFLPAVSDSVRRNTVPKEDHLKNRYLVFSCNFHGGENADLDAYLRGMWNAISDRIKELWNYCYGFEKVRDAESFIRYMKQCQMEASLFFNGSNDEPLPEQLKALYLKQEFAKFVIDNQGLDASHIKVNLQAFMQRVAPTNLTAPTWAAGKYRI
jgi:hypothetical protein